jgi:hypothetical protein
MNEHGAGLSLLEHSNAPFSFPVLVVGVDASKGKFLPFCKAGCLPFESLENTIVSVVMFHMDAMQAQQISNACFASRTLSAVEAVFCSHANDKFEQ